MSLATGTRLGRYELIASLGTGGMGEVYRARDTRLERDVAIKVLPERFAQDPQALTRFQREAKAVAALSHPNILAIYDIGSDQSMTYAVMELLEGQTLGSRIRRAPLDWRSWKIAHNPTAPAFMAGSQAPSATSPSSASNSTRTSPAAKGA